MTRLAVALLLGTPCAAAGAVSGIAGVAFHTRPWGWWLAVIGTTAALVALPAGAARVGFGLGWLGVLGLASWGRPEGDWVIGQDLAGYGLLGVGLVHVVLITATLPGRRHDRQPLAT